jgi:dTMP kinase
MKGKFIVIYGVNNLGKTTQANLLADELNSEGLKARYLKYPRYGVEPAGKLINEYLREGNPRDFNPRELQLLHYIDRLFNQPFLYEALRKGVNVIAEDYFGTAMAWGAANGVDTELLKYLNKFILPPDLAILLDGERFKEARESGHAHEEDEELIEKARQAHLQLAKEYGWMVIQANRSISEVRERILNYVKVLFS